MKRNRRYDELQSQYSRQKRVCEDRDDVAAEHESEYRESKYQLDRAESTWQNLAGRLQGLRNEYAGMERSYNGCVDLYNRRLESVRIWERELNHGNPYPQRRTYLIRNIQWYRAEMQKLMDQMNRLKYQMSQYGSAIQETQSQCNDASREHERCRVRFGPAKDRHEHALSRYRSAKETLDRILGQLRATPPEIPLYEDYEFTRYDLRVRAWSEVRWRLVQAGRDTMGTWKRRSAERSYQDVWNKDVDSQDSEGHRPDEDELPPVSRVIDETQRQATKESSTQIVTEIKSALPAWRQAFELATRQTDRRSATEAAAMLLLSNKAEDRDRLKAWVRNYLLEQSMGEPDRSGTDGASSIKEY